MSRATVDVEAVRLFFGMGLLSLAQTLLLFGGITYLLVSMDWQLALLSLAFLPAIGWRAVTFSRRLQPIWLKIQQLLGVMGTTLEESLTGIRIVKAFTRQNEESRAPDAPEGCSHHSPPAPPRRASGSAWHSAHS